MRLAARLRPGAAVAAAAITGNSTLPDDLLVESCRRVRIVALITAGLWAFALLMNELLYPLVSHTKEYWRAAWEGVGPPVCYAGIVASAAMFWATRHFAARPSRVMTLGLVFEVVTAALIAVMQWWHPLVMHGGRVSWVGVFILVYPSIAPSTERATLVASLAAATTEVVCVALAAARGVLPPDATPITIGWMLVGGYICAFLAIVPVRVIRGLSRQVASARELGSYRLERRLGKGAMGEVHLATHRLLARPAAIKLMRPEVLGAAPPERVRAFAERFRREANAAASLRSPHTIQLYDFGVADDGTFYYVMELLDGLDLDALVRRFGPQPPERVVHFLVQACASLAEAHARGLVHRDVKPSNLYTACVGLETDVLKVLDFGLVRVDADRDAEDGSLAQGTPAYMAPEAILRPETVDARTDLYALGCVGWWLLTGRPVFTATVPADVMLQHAHAAPEPPSRYATQAVPAELDAVLLACLAKNPDERPQSALDLSSWLAVLTPAARWTPERAAAWWQAHRDAITAAVGEPETSATLLPTRLLD